MVTNGFRFPVSEGGINTAKVKEKESETSTRQQKEGVRERLWESAA